MALAHPVDLIISDILMPVMDGFTLCREWQADENLRRIPFIFYTATYTDQKDVDFGLGLGAAGYLIKPLEADTLMTTIGGVLGQNASEPAVSAAIREEAVYLQEYNQALIRKLESKMLQLEKEVQIRRQTEAQTLRFKTAIENTDDAILLINAQGQVEYVNPAFEKTTGYSREEILDRPPDFLKNANQGPIGNGDAWDTGNRSKAWRGHLTKKSKAGRTIEFEAIISPIPGGSRNPFRRRGGHAGRHPANGHGKSVGAVPETGGHRHAGGGDRP